MPLLYALTTIGSVRLQTGRTRICDLHDVKRLSYAHNTDAIREQTNKILSTIFV